MVRTTAAISPHRHPNDAAHWPFSVGEVTRAAHLGKQLIQAWPDVIGELHFYNGFQANGPKNFPGYVRAVRAF